MAGLFPRVHDNSAVVATINELPNELIVRILSYITDRRDLWAFLLTQRRWFQLGIDRVWVRPPITSAAILRSLCGALNTDAHLYAHLVRRLNLSGVAHHVNQETLRPFLVCTQLERLALAGAPIQDESVIIELIKLNPHLSSLDLSGVRITDLTLFAVAEFVPQLHGLYATNCPGVSDIGISALARSCKYLRRLKLAGTSVSKASLNDVVEFCPYMLELDVSQCGMDDSTVALILRKLRNIRELRLNGNTEITGGVLDQVQACDSLRLIDFGACPNISDGTIEQLVELAPRLHQVVLGKCFNVTDRSLNALAGLEQNLHYIHLGHCTRVTDRGVANLVKWCPRLQYVDVANCARLTNEAVAYIARLPRLRRIGLVKCIQINDEGILWLAKRLPSENTLERVHLSYCNNISFQAVASLVNNCPRLTHLSLTGVSSFMRPDLAQFCRQPPPDLTQHQQAVFCVFSGQGVLRLREYINRAPPTPSFLSLFPSSTAGGNTTNNPARIAQLAEAQRELQPMEAEATDLAPTDRAQNQGMY